MPVEQKQIFVVDDEEVLRETICSMLTSAGLQCKAFGGGLDALALLDAGEKCDLLITDLMNSPLDGISLLERVKKEYPKVEVIIVSEVQDDSVKEQCYRIGAFLYLQEPFERTQLLDAVNLALEYRSLKARVTEQVRPPKREPDFTTGTVLFALLLNKSAIGVYSSHEEAEAAWNAFHDQNPAAGAFAIKPFKLDGPAMIYRPY